MRSFSSEEQKSFARIHAQDQDFFPYTCHYDEHTILTKNAQLLQTIKVTGFHAELVGSKEQDLRQLIRSVVQKHIKSEQYAIWLQTIRTKKNLTLPGKYQGAFTRELNKSWVSFNSWDHKFVNELYITLIREVKSVKDQKKLSNFLSFSLLKRREKKVLEAAHSELDQISKNIYNDLKDFGAKRLGLLKVNGVYYSQFARFLGKIVNFEAKNRPLLDQDLSLSIPTSQVAFGGDSYQVRREDGHKYFGAVFTVKEYSELSGRLLDSFLQLEQEFIITQTFSIVDRKKALKNYEEQYNLLAMSGSRRFAENLGLTKILEDKKSSINRFGQHQITLNFFAESQQDLEANIAQAIKKLNNFGLVVVRENVFLESSYWSQLPGNFYYILRRSPIDVSRFAGFSSLYNHPAGNLTSEAWGDAITIFYTVNNIPYFFNFHHGKNGHTMILGPRGSGKTVLLNFLIAQSLKHNPNIFYIDFFNSSEVFIEAIGGYYESFDPDKDFIGLNPFALEDNEDNRQFLVKFLGYLTISKQDVTSGKYEPSQKKKDIFEKVVSKLYSLPKRERDIAMVAKILESTPLAPLMEPWVNDGNYARIFDNINDEIEKHKKCVAIDFTAVAERTNLLVPLLSYYLYKIETLLDGEPAIIVIDEAWKLVDNIFLAPTIKSFLERVANKNAIVIFASESMEDVKNSKITSFITKNFSTELFLPYSDLDDACKGVFNLSNTEFSMLSEIKNDARHFMLKHNNESVIVDLDLTSMEHLVSILSSSTYSLEIKEKVQKKVGKDPEDWVPIYFEVFKDIMNIDSATRDFGQAIKDVDLDSYENRASMEAQEEISKNITQHKSTIISEIDD